MDDGMMGETIKIKIGDKVRLYNSEDRYQGPGVVIGIEDDEYVKVEYYLPYRKCVSVFERGRVEMIK